jgi:ParB family chromosome partitioning protein
MSERQVRRLETLKPYPRQPEVFDALTDVELEHLMQSIARDGLQHPPDILPNGTIIDGHHRWIACARLGWTEMPVNVRYDLEGKSVEEIDRIFIESNLSRRQMDLLQVARAYVALKSNSKNRGKPGDVRDHLAKRFGKSGRMLDRYARLLTLPRSLQAAVSRKQLTLASAESLLQLPRKQLNEIAERFEQGSPLRSLLPGKVAKGHSDMLTGMVVRGFHSRLKQLHRAYQEDRRQLPLTKSQESALRGIRDLIDRLLSSDAGQSVRPS